MKTKSFLLAILMFVLLFQASMPSAAQSKTEVFDKVKMLVPNGNKVNEKDVRLLFLENELQIEAVPGGEVLKIYKYAEIKNSEYSYTKSPRWKSGLGLGTAAFFLFPPLLFVEIPPGFTKHRRHWLTIKTGDDYAVLKLSKKNRKLILPALETKAGIEVKGRGEDK